MKTCLMALMLIIPSLSMAEDYPMSDHFNGERFFNPGGPGLKSFWNLLKWKATSKAAEWPEHMPNKDYKLPLVGDKKAVVTFINHATFLIQLPGLTILTDPIFSERAGPFQSFGPVKRVRAPGVALEQLPAIDVVLVSHNHYDHLDVTSLKALDAKFKPLFLVPLGDEKLLWSEGLQNVHPLDWWGEQKIKEGRIVFTPVQHWSARGVFDKNKSLWGGYFIDLPPVKVYFTGDSGYSGNFLQTKNRLGAPDIALIPVGAYEPRWFMKDHHMDPEEAVKAHLDLGAGVSFGMHFGTFQLTDEAYDSPAKDLKAARERLLVPEDKFRLLDFGESFSY